MIFGSFIYNSFFLKVLLNFYFYFFENNLGDFYVSILYLQMLTEKSQKISHKYLCEKCNYKTFKKNDYEKHLLTMKHTNLHNTYKCDAIINYVCECGKEYKHRQSLYTHKKTCKGICDNDNVLLPDSKDNMKELVLQLINQNSELQKTIHEMIPKIGNHNNNSNNNIKQKFNINVFLNEKCKDALSMDEFIDKIEVSMKNLLTTKEKGQVNGISNIIIENMNKLSLYERPLHCTDKKRETLYVKNNEWEKDDSKEHINKALKKVESKQLKNLNVWLEEHPNYMNNSLEQEEFAKLMSECGKSIDDGREKIIKKLCDNVYLDKE